MVVVIMSKADPSWVQAVLVTGLASVAGAAAGRQLRRGVGWRRRGGTTVHTHNQ